MDNERINKKLKITLIIFVVTAVVTLVLILNKGKVFGHRLVSISDETIEETHAIQVVAGKYKLSADGGQTELYITVDGEDITEGFGIIVSDEDVVSVDGTTITALEEGIVTITITSEEYEIATEITIEVVETITKLVLDSEYKKIEIDEQSQMSYECTPSTATVEITYASSDESIATINEDGIVTGVSEGKATIIATDNITGKTASYSIEVTD